MLQEDLGDIEQIQLTLLHAILESCAETNYGRQCRFDSITDEMEFAKLPFMRYDSEHLAAGFWDAPENFTSERLLAYFLTSGSTAHPKKIPVTPSLVRQKSKAFARFWSSVYRDHPILKNGNFIANFADSGVSRKDANGVVETSETTFWNQRMQGFQSAERWPIGRVLGQIDDADLRYYAAARLSLQGELHCIMTLNPSTIVRFCQGIESNWDELLRGLRDGTWGISELDRADIGLGERSLDSPVARYEHCNNSNVQDGGLSLKQLWPELELIICWQSDRLKPYLALLKNYAEGIDFRDYISQSSECIMAIPDRDNHPGGWLAYESHFFEFIPESESSSETPVAVTAWQLEAGQKYELVATTGGGLIRYRTGDCFLVETIENGVPYIQFQYRLGKTSSITGEKLTEQQVLNALDQALVDKKLSINDILMFPRSGRYPHYGILIADPGEGSDDDQLRRFLGSFERELSRQNPEYADKRSSARLGHPVLLIIRKSDFQVLRNSFRADHIGDDQYKPSILESVVDIDKSADIVREIYANSSSK